MNLSLNRRWAISILLVPILFLAMFLVWQIFSTRDSLNRDVEQGLIVLSNVSLVQDRGRYFLDASVDIKLPITIRSGLDSGVPLIFVLTLQFLEPSRYWFDKQLETIEHRFSLTYYELTRHYRVRRLSTNTHHNYRSLSSALRGLGTIESLPLLLNKTSPLLTDGDTDSSNSKDALIAVLDFRLDSQSLPLPLQPVITSSWRLASEELSWPVN